MSKAFLFGSNNATQALASGANVNLGTPVHGFGKKCCERIIALNNGAITLNEDGYYSFILGFTVTNSEAGNVTLTAYQDGNTVPITAQSEAIAAVNDPANITLAFGVVVPKCASSTITVVATSSAGTPTITNVTDLVSRE